MQTRCEVQLRIEDLNTRRMGENADLPLTGKEKQGQDRGELLTHRPTTCELESDDLEMIIFFSWRLGPGPWGQWRRDPEIAVQAAASGNCEHLFLSAGMATAVGRTAAETLGSSYERCFFGTFIYNYQ